MRTQSSRRGGKIQGKRTILLTGFRPYGGERSNASQALIRALRRHPPSLKQVATLNFAILPAEPLQLEAALHVLLRRHQPDDVLMFGQAPGRNRICLERVARNQFQDRPVRSGGQACYRATLPGQARTLRALHRAGIPARFSDDAGDYLCNMALYLVLEHARKTGSNTRAGFVHVPVLPRQVINFWPDAPCLSLDTLQQAARLILATLAVERKATY